MADDKDQKINLRRLIDQSALMQNIDILKNTGFVKIDSGPFVNGISLDDEGSFENSGITINKIYNFKEFIKAYNQLTPASLSALIPYIQIWKVYEDDTEFFIPFNNFYPKTAIDSITNAGSDRGYQANLVSLDFISQGKDTATTFIYQVKMNIIFDSIQTLFNEKSRYIELFNPPKKNKFKRGDRDPKYYQIKLKFGWNFNNDLPSDLKPQQLKVFSDASGSEMYLSYVIHKLTINEDGSVALQVEYIGALEAAARDSTKLTVLSSKKIEQLDNISQQIEEIEGRINKTETGIVIDQSEDEDGKITVKIMKGSEDVSEKYKNDKNSLEELYKQRSSSESNNRKEFMNGILKNIQEQYSGSFPQLLIRNNVYERRNSLIQAYSSLSEVDRLKRIEEARNLTSAETNPNNVRFEWNIFKTNEEAQKFDLDAYLKQIDNPPVINLPKNATEQGYMGAAAAEALIQFYNIPFFTFGRLLKALYTLGPPEDGSSQESNFLILCSDCNIASFGNGNFINAKDLANNPEYKIYIDNGMVIGDNLAVLKNEVRMINITQIPIALSTFKYWINKNITFQNITQMSLLNFLNLAITDLLNLAVKSTNEDYVPTQNIQFKFFFDKININNDDKFLNLIRQNQGQGEILGASSYSDKISNFVANKELNSSNIIKKNIIIFYTNPTHNTRKSNFMKDLEDGIPHFFYGQNRTIINKITFREENMPYVREANIQTQVDRKPWKAGVFLRGKYNVLIEMLGTVNFRIGSMIYIAPSFPGVVDYSDPIEYGIGGYFVIISIKTSIESGKYITNLEANWVSTGTGEYTDLSHLPFKIIKLTNPLPSLETQQENAAKTKESTDSAMNNTPPAAAKKGST